MMSNEGEEENNPSLSSSEEEVRETFCDSLQKDDDEDNEARARKQEGAVGGTSPIPLNREDNNIETSTHSSEEVGEGGVNDSNGDEEEEGEEDVTSFQIASVHRQLVVVTKLILRLFFSGRMNELSCSFFKGR